MSDVKTRLREKLNGKGSKKEKTICLVMIVKNEIKVLPRCFDSVKGIISAYSICDTGSTDGTPEYIRNYWSNLGIPGKVYDDPWKNFGYNRTHAVSWGRSQNCDLLMLMDADFVFNLKDPEFRSKIPDNVDGFLIKYDGELDYRQNLLVNSKKRWRYVGVTHEYIEMIRDTNKKGELGPAQVTESFDGFTFFHAADGGNRSDKFIRDKKLLLAGVEEEPKNGRYFFYLAQTCFDLGHYEEAIKYYKKRIELPGFQEEDYFARYRLGLAKYKAGHDFFEVFGQLLGAWDFRKSRLEALHDLITYCQERGDYKLGFQIGIMALDTPYPSKDYLFIDSSVHKWRFKFELAKCGIECCKATEVSNICNTLLKEKFYPSYVESDIKKLYMTALKQLKFIKNNESKQAAAIAATAAAATPATSATATSANATAANASHSPCPSPSPSPGTKASTDADASATKDLATKDLATKDLATKDSATKDLATKDLATKDLATNAVTDTNNLDMGKIGQNKGVNIVLYLRRAIDNLSEMLSVLTMQDHLNKIYVYLATDDIQMPDLESCTNSMNIKILKTIGLGSRLSILRHAEVFEAENILIFDQDRKPGSNLLSELVKAHKRMDNDALIGYWGWKLAPPQFSKNNEMITLWECLPGSQGSEFVSNVDDTVDYLCGLWFGSSQIFFKILEIDKVAEKNRMESLNYLNSITEDTPFRLEDRFPTGDIDDRRAFDFTSDYDLRTVDDIRLCLHIASIIKPRVVRLDNHVLFHVPNNVYYGEGDVAQIRHNEIARFCKNGYQTTLTNQGAFPEDSIALAASTEATEATEATSSTSLKATASSLTATASSLEKEDVGGCPEDDLPPDSDNVSQNVNNREQIILQNVNNREQIILQNVNNREQIILQNVNNREQIISQNVNNREQIILQNVNNREQIILQNVNNREQIILQNNNYSQDIISTVRQLKEKEKDSLSEAKQFNYTRICIFVPDWTSIGGSELTIRDLYENLKSTLEAVAKGIEIKITNKAPEVYGFNPNLLITQQFSIQPCSEIASRLNIPFWTLIHGPGQGIAHPKATLYIYNSMHLMESDNRFPKSKKIFLQPSININKILNSETQKSKQKRNEIKASNKTITFIGSTGYNYLKGSDLVIELARKMSSFKFVYIGPVEPIRYDTDYYLVGKMPPLEPANIKYRTIIPNNLHVMTNTHDLEPIWNKTAIIIIPSIVESFGRVAVEAAAHNIPVIASDLPGLREATANLAFYVKNYRNVDLWADMIKKTLGPNGTPQDSKAIIDTYLQLQKTSLNKIYEYIGLTDTETVTGTPGAPVAVDVSVEKPEVEKVAVEKVAVEVSVEKPEVEKVAEDKPEIVADKPEVVVADKPEVVVADKPEAEKKTTPSIIYINLDRRTDRNASLLQKFNSLTHKCEKDGDLRLERFPAIDGNALKMTPENAYLLRNNTFHNRKNTLACAKSHIEIWKRLISSNQEYAVVIEDDIDFSENFVPLWNSLINSISSCKEINASSLFDLLWFGYSVTPGLEDEYNKTFPKDILNIVPMIDNNYWCGAYGYIISYAGAQKLLDVIEKFGLTHPIDTIMMHAMRNHYGNFRGLATLPILVTTQIADDDNNVDTDVQRNYDSVPFDLKIKVWDKIINEKIKSLHNCNDSDTFDLCIANISHPNINDIADPVLILDEEAMTLSAPIGRNWASLSLREDTTDQISLQNFINEYCFKVWAEIYPLKYL
jgi:GR25 family glycosyltransferase involved in LPS biosynthesis/glycosyltransferase involved in cell wall biosynthesis/tetratricopeptide (TPR) repeat protein